MGDGRRAFFATIAGLSILIVDFRNDAVVPDVLGYLSIAFGLHVLASLDASFARGRWCAIAAGVASLFAMTTRALWPGFVQAFFEIVSIWLLCSGVVHRAAALENRSLVRAAANARTLTILAGALNFAYAALFYGFRVAVPYMTMVLLAFGWSVVAIVMVVTNRAANELGQRYALFED